MFAARVESEFPLRSKLLTARMQKAPEKDDKLPEAEADARFDRAIKTALATPPKPHKPKEQPHEPRRNPRTRRADKA